MINFQRYASLSSTMDEARAQALKGAKDGTVIVAKHQTAGRGRRGRVWDSLPGNLFFTYITYPGRPLVEAPQLSFVACVAVGEALRPFLPPRNTLLYKWPNDILLNEKKVAGILTETLSLPDKAEMAYLIGCGINLVSSPREARYPSTSFQEESLEVPYEEALHKIGTSLQHHLVRWQEEGFSTMRQVWMDFAMGLGTPLSFDLERDRVDGIFQGIDDEGALILKTPQELIKLRAGEVLRGGSSHFLSFPS